MRVLSRRLIWLVPVGLACLLVGCGSGSGSNGTSYVKTINAYVYQRSWFSLNVNVGAVPIGQNLGFGDATLRYTKVGSGTEREIELSPTGGQLPPETIPSTLSDNQYYTVIATANGSNLGATVLADDPAPPASGNFKIRIADEAYTAGPVDIYVVSAGTDIDDPKNPTKPLVSNLTAGAASPYLQVAAGTYSLFVTKYGDPSSVLASVPSTGLGPIPADHTYTAVLLDPHNIPSTASGIGTSIQFLQDFPIPSTTPVPAAGSMK